MVPSSPMNGEQLSCSPLARPGRSHLAENRWGGHSCPPSASECGAFLPRRDGRTDHLRLPCRMWPKIGGADLLFRFLPASPGHSCPAEMAEPTTCNCPG